MYIVCIICPTKDDSLHLIFVLVPKYLVSWNHSYNKYALVGRQRARWLQSLVQYIRDMLDVLYCNYWVPSSYYRQWLLEICLIGQNLVLVHCFGHRLVCLFVYFKNIKYIHQINFFSIQYKLGLTIAIGLKVANSIANIFKIAQLCIHQFSDPIHRGIQTVKVGKYALKAF